MNEKLGNTEKILSEVESAKTIIERNYEEKITTQKSKFNNERNDLKSNIERLEERNQKMESELNNKNNSLEMQNALLENRLKNLQ